LAPPPQRFILPTSTVGRVRWAYVPEDAFVAHVLTLLTSKPCADNKRIGAKTPGDFRKIPGAFDWLEVKNQHSDLVCNRCNQAANTTLARRREEARAAEEAARAAAFAAPASVTRNAAKQSGATVTEWAPAPPPTAATAERRSQEVTELSNAAEGVSAAPPGKRVRKDVGPSSDAAASHGGLGAFVMPHPHTQPAGGGSGGGGGGGASVAASEGAGAAAAASHGARAGASVASHPHTQSATCGGGGSPVIASEGDGAAADAAAAGAAAAADAEVKTSFTKLSRDELERRPRRMAAEIKRLKRAAAVHAKQRRAHGEGENNGGGRGGSRGGGGGAIGGKMVCIESAMARMAESTSPLKQQLFPNLALCINNNALDDDDDGNRNTFNPDNGIFLEMVANVVSNGARGHHRTPAARYSTNMHTLCSLARKQPSSNAAVDMLSRNLGWPVKGATNHHDMSASPDPSYREGLSVANSIALLSSLKDSKEFEDIEFISAEEYNITAAPEQFPKLWNVEKYAKMGDVSSALPASTTTLPAEVPTAGLDAGPLFSPT
jgi:hypothetical protein